MADVGHVRWRGKGSVEVLIAGVRGPVCSRLSPAVRFAVDAAVSGCERVPELNGGVGIHWVRRVYASYEGEARGGE